MTFNFETMHHDDVIIVEDITDRMDELEALRDDNGDFPNDYFIVAEYAHLEAILEDLKGNGGDHQWNGDWYPATLISESYFNEYMDDMVADCYGLPELPSFMTITLDYHALLMDYTSIELNGITYYYR